MNCVAECMQQTFQDSAFIISLNVNILYYFLCYVCTFLLLALSIVDVDSNLIFLHTVECFQGRNWVLVILVPPCILQHVEHNSCS